MTKAELKRELETASVSPEAYSLDGGLPGECYVLSKEPQGKWDVYYSERGVKTGLRSFDSESEACDCLLKLLLDDPTVG